MNISDIFFSSSTLLNCISKKYYTNALNSRFHSFFTEIVYQKKFKRSYSKEWAGYVMVDELGGLILPNYITSASSIC